VTPTTAPVRDQDELFPMLVRVPRHLHMEVKERAQEEDRTLAQVVRRALRLYLSQPSD